MSFLFSDETSLYLPQLGATFSQCMMAMVQYTKVLLNIVH